MPILEIVNKKAPKVKGVKVSNDEPLPNIREPLPDWNYCSLVIGQPGSGKTSLILNLLSKYYKKKYDRIYLFSGSLQTLPEKFIEKLNEERIFTSLDDLEGVIQDLKEAEDKPKVLILIDDLLKEIGENHKIIAGLLWNRRHIAGGVGLYIIGQKFNAVPTTIRSAIDTIYFFSMNNKKETNALFEDYINDLDRKEFDEMVKYCLENGRKHSFLFIDKRNGKYYLNFNELKILDNNSNNDTDPKTNNISIEEIKS